MRVIHPQEWLTAKIELELYELVQYLCSCLLDLPEPRTEDQAKLWLQATKRLAEISGNLGRRKKRYALFRLSPEAPYYSSRMEFNGDLKSLLLDLCASKPDAVNAVKLGGQLEVGSLVSYKAAIGDQGPRREGR